MMKIAALQMQSVPGNVDANLARIHSAAREAHGLGASILVAPELALTGYGARDDITALAETTDGAFARRLEAIARETGVAILTGFSERDGKTVRNSAIYVDGDAPPTVYQKSHLYGTYEKDIFAAAPPSTVVIKRGGLRLGVLICYDVEFPENVRRLAVTGVDAVLVPTALPAGDHANFIARSMVPVRAFENQIFLAYVNHCGCDANFAYAGLSSIVAPDGTLLASADAASQELLIARIDPADYDQSATANSYLADLKT